MKRILLAIAMLALVLPAMRQAEAGVDVSVDFFYDNIGSDGNWVELADYGYCWQPSVAVSNSHWRPYSDGYWAYTDVGWTWVSYEDFGWATYHYGRWVRLRDRGWLWVPGREWGPAWVSWRTGGDYVGWAPLPPRGRGEDYDDRPINGQVDIDFDIGPEYYNFVDVRYIGEPVLRERIVQPSLNITYISNTVNVTNITYTNSVVYNYGPDYDRLSRYSTRPIRRMTLERDNNVDLSVAVQSKGLTRVQGDKLIVAAPLKFQKPSKPVAPKMVKEKIEKPNIEHGWSGSDPKAQADLKQKMKSEDAKNVPPPSIKPRDNAEAAQSPAGASPAPPAAGTTPAAPASPAISKPMATAAPTAPAATTPGKDKRLEGASPMPSVAPVKPAASPAMTPPGKSKKDRGEKPAPAVSPSSATVPDANPAVTPHKPKEKPNSPSTLATSPDGTPVRDTPAHDQGVKKDKHPEKAPDMTPAAKPTVERPSPKPKISSEPMPPTREAPPKPKITSEPKPQTHQAPTEPPHKQPPTEAPKERTAPPSGPAANPPAQQQPPHNKKGPDKKTNEPAPSPGS